MERRSHETSGWTHETSFGAAAVLGAARAGPAQAEDLRHGLQGSEQRLHPAAAGRLQARRRRSCNVDLHFHGAAGIQRGGRKCRWCRTWSSAASTASPCRPATRRRWRACWSWPSSTTSPSSPSIPTCCRKTPACARPSSAPTTICSAPSSRKLTKQLKPKGGTVCIQSGAPASLNLNDRIQGIRDTLAGAPRTTR